MDFGKYKRNSLNYFSQALSLLIALAEEDTVPTQKEICFTLGKWQLKLQLNLQRGCTLYHLHASIGLKFFLIKIF